MAATAKAIFDGDSAKLDAVIKGLDRKLLGLQAQFASISKTMAVAFALPAAAATGLAVGVGKVLEVGDNLADLHNNTGIAIDDLVVLGAEFQMAGKSGEDVVGVIQKMQKAIATGSANDVIAGLGLDLEALKEMTPVDQFHALGNAINGLQTPAEKTAAAMALFGKTGGTMLSLFASQGFADAARAVGAQAAILKQDAQLFSDVNDQLGLVGIKTQGFFVGVADRIVPVLEPLLKEFNQLDLAAMGQDVGNFIAVLVEAVADNKIGDILGTELQIAAIMFGDGLEAAITRASEHLMDQFPGLQLLGKVVGNPVDALSAAIPGASLLTGTARKNVTGDSGLAELQTHFSETIGSLMERVNAAHAKALADHKTSVPGTGEFDDLLGKAGGNFSSLARVGGAFGAGGGDPLLDATREQTSILREIRAALTEGGDKYAKPGGVEPRYA